MNVFKNLFKSTESKELALLDSIAKSFSKQEANFADFLRDGGQKPNEPDYTGQAYVDYYKKNPIIFKCINLLSTAISNLTIQAYNRGVDEPLENSDFIQFLQRPNAKETENSFFQSWSVYHLIHGQSFLYKTKDKRGNTLELNLLNPLDVSVSGSGGYFPQSYRITQGNYQISFNVNQITGEIEPLKTDFGTTELMHFKDLDPACGSYDGLSPLEPIAFAIDSHQYGMKWNRNLLQNSARPSTAYQTDQALTVEQAETLVEMLKKYEGKDNVGKSLLLDKGIKSQQLSLTPTDMDFSNMLDKMSEYIAAALGIPYVLVVPVQATYNNISEAKISLYRDTVLPLAARMLEALSMFFEGEYPDIELKYNEEQIEALSKEREVKISSMREAAGVNFVTINEARSQSGYADIGAEGDDVLIQTGMIPLSMAGSMDEQIEGDLGNGESETEQERPKDEDLDAEPIG